MLLTLEQSRYGSEEEGFDPKETRIYRNARYRPSESGCG